MTSPVEVAECYGMKGSRIRGHPIFYPGWLSAYSGLNEARPKPPESIVQSLQF
jgi:hypothetical protein